MTAEAENFLKTAPPESILSEYFQLRRAPFLSSEDGYRLQVLGRFLSAAITEGRDAGINALPPVRR